MITNFLISSMIVMAAFGLLAFGHDWFQGAVKWHGK